MTNNQTSNSLDALSEVEGPSGREEEEYQVDALSEVEGPSGREEKEYQVDALSEVEGPSGRVVGSMRVLPKKLKQRQTAVDE